MPFLDPDEAVLLLGNSDETKPAVNNVFDDVKNRQTYWHAQYVSSQKDEAPSSVSHSLLYPRANSHRRFHSNWTTTIELSNV